MHRVQKVYVSNNGLNRGTLILLQVKIPMTIPNINPISIAYTEILKV